MSPTLSEKCQFHVIPSSGIQGPSVSCDARPVKSDEQEDMDTERGEGQLSLTINVHVGEWTCLSVLLTLVSITTTITGGIVTCIVV